MFLFEVDLYFSRCFSVRATRAWSKQLRWKIIVVLSLEYNVWKKCAAQVTLFMLVIKNYFFSYSDDVSWFLCSRFVCAAFGCPQCSFLHAWINRTGFRWVVLVWAGVNCCTNTLCILSLAGVMNTEEPVPSFSWKAGLQSLDTNKNVFNCLY